MDSYHVGDPTSSGPISSCPFHMSLGRIARSAISSRLRLHIRSPGRAIMDAFPMPSFRFSFHFFSQ